MPSGFQQDPNQLSPSYYRVIITMYDGSTYWPAYNDDAGYSAGRVNPFNWDAYIDIDGNPVPPSSDANGIALAQGNLRWQSILDELGRFADFQILDLEVQYDDPPEDANSNPTTLAFTVKYDRDEFVFPAYSKFMDAEGLTSSYTTTTIEGSTYNMYWSCSGALYQIQTTADVIRELVFRGINRGYDSVYSKSWRVWNDTKLEGLQDIIRIEQPYDTNDYNRSDLFSDIAVQEIDGTELITNNGSDGQ